MNFKKNIKKFSVIRILLIISILIANVLSQDEKLFELNKNYTGSLEKDGMEYFYLILPNNIKNNTYTLVFKIEEDKGSDPLNREDFSDVDLYISRTNKRPNHKNNCEWYSEHWGDDILTISKEFINSDVKFYLGVYCQFKCHYKVSAYLSDTIELFNGRLHNYNIKKNTVLAFKFKAKKDFEMLTFNFNSNNRRPFKVYLSDKNPTTTNSFKLQPSWFSGYTIDVEKGSRYYCSECEYKMIIGAYDFDVQITILIVYTGTSVTIKGYELVLDSVSKEKYKCYNYYLKSEDIKYRNDPIIIRANLFAGFGYLRIFGYDNNPNISYYNLKKDNLNYTNLFNQTYVYEITGERVIILQQKDKENLKKISKNEPDFLHFCIYGKERSSYMISTHYSSFAERFQRGNYLNMGQSVLGYLPKGQVTRYRIYDFSKNSNISIIVDDDVGKIKLFGKFTNSNNNIIYDEKNLQREISNRSLIFSDNQFYDGSRLYIYDDNNICHKKFKENTNLNQEYEKFDCALYAIIFCDSTLNTKDCMYRIRVNSDISTQLMSPRTTYYNILSKNNSNYYIITIDDEDISLISIICTTVTGDISLFVYEYFEELNYTKLIRQSMNEFGLPEVIYLNKTRLGKPNLKGTYQITVKANTFSTYSLYYYTNKPKKETSKDNQVDEDDNESIELTLKSGEIIESIFSNNDIYKIYKYENKDLDSDIIISLAKTANLFELYVYKSFSKIKINTEFLNKNISQFDIYRKDLFLNYDWRNNLSNNLIIQKNDPKYSSNGIYYLVLSRTLKSMQNTLPATQSLYFGVTNTKKPFLIHEGIQHLGTLTQIYKEQTYLYTHTNVSEPFSLSVNIFFGKIDIYLDFEPIIPKIENRQEDKIYLKYLNKQQAEFAEIQPNELKSNCKSSENCLIYIYINQKSPYTSQYLLIPKSHKNRPIILTPGLVQENMLRVKEKHYFIIEQFSAQKDGAIFIKLIEGNADIYMNLYSGTNINQEIFPTNEKYTYKGDEYYQGKMITIGNLQKEECTPNCRYLITVEGKSLGSLNQIVYSLSYSNVAKTIHQNEPYKTLIKNGEMHYYKFYFDENANSIYLNLYCSDGDADLYMNYGEKLPTPKVHDWHSEDPQMDFLTIDKNDPFFVNKKITSLRGYYTILIYGYTQTTYTLSITSHPKKIIPLGNNSPASCQCKQAGEYCYFRFSDLYYVWSYSSIDRTKKPDDISIVFTTNYLYGSGDQYVKLYNESNFDIMENLPNENNYDYSNREKKKRNFLKIDVSWRNNSKLTWDSMFLISVKCYEKSLFEMNSARISKGNYRYLDIRRENLFYLEKSNNPTLLNFYYQLDKNLNYEIYVFTGSANFLIYQNESVYNSQKRSYEYEYNHISNFDIDKNSNNPYYNYVSRDTNKIGKNIYFKITPTQDIGFYIKLTYDQEWTRVLIGKPNVFLINNDVFNGYFDILPEFNDVIISLSLSHTDFRAKIFVKINIYDRKRDENSGDNMNPFNFEYPTENINDISASTDILGTASLNIEKIDKSVFENKSVRILFKIKSSAIKRDYDKDILRSIKLVVMPSVNNYKRIEALPLSIYYSAEKKLDKEKTVFDLAKIKETDDIFVIELSSCSGEFKAQLTSDISSYNTNDDDDKIKKTIYEEYGRTVIIGNNMNNSNYYLSVKGTKFEEDCSSVDKKCSPNTVEYLLYYYTTDRSKYQKTKLDSILMPKQIGMGKIEIVVGYFRQKDIYGHYENLNNIKYKLFISENQEDLKKMSSLCLLSKMNSLPEKISYNYNENTRTFYVENLKHGINYYINVLTTNVQTGELFVFTPTTIMLTTTGSISTGFIVTIVIIFAILISIIIFFYFKYSKAKEIIKYERNDLGSMASLPSDSINSVVEREKEKEGFKYITLKSDPGAI